MRSSGLKSLRLMQGDTSVLLFSMTVYVVIFSFILVWFTDVATTVVFEVGSVTSIVCGWMGMEIDVAVMSGTGTV